jgi:hypothetical protein
VIRVTSEIREIKVILEMSDLLEQQELLEPLEHKVTSDQLDQRVTQVIQEQLDPQALLDHKVIRETRVILEMSDLLEQQVPLVLKVM